ncbi:MAG: sigma-54 dependent transcriptional regulator [Acidobacteriota bacterium]|nr:sigma-54 dependent transcriptional regulator [Acidobacteriota bacterium]
MSSANASSPDMLRTRLALGLVIGPSKVFEKVLTRIQQVAAYDVSVLISGETGTGKEVCARAIHYLSKHASRAFVPVNCGAIPADLMESELFGHERGAFTGAHAPHEGLVRMAEGGTLFLDEIDSLPPHAQVKLLRFLQEGEYRPVGANKFHKANLRVLAASNRDLADAVARGDMREDLFYRLNVVPVQMPSLRERPEDIPYLARHFLERAARHFEKTPLNFGRETLDLMINYAWPGNVRELEHVVQRAALLCRDGKVRPGDLELPLTKPKPVEPFQQAKERTVRAFERDYLTRVLAVNGGNISQAAKCAGKHRRVFFELIRKHQIDAARYRPG